MTNEEVIQTTENLCFVQNVGTTIFLVALMIVMRDRPKEPPSAVSLSQPENHAFVEYLKRALKNKNFVYLLVIYAMVYGVFNVFGVVINPFLEGCGFSATETSIVGGLCVISGVLSSLIVGCFLDKHPRYLIVIRAICFGSLAVAAIGFFTYPIGNKPVIYA